MINIGSTNFVRIFNSIEYHVDIVALIDNTNESTIELDLIDTLWKTFYLIWPPYRSFKTNLKTSNEHLAGQKNESTIELDLLPLQFCGNLRGWFGGSHRRQTFGNLWNSLSGKNHTLIKYFFNWTNMLGYDYQVEICLD